MCQGIFLPVRQLQRTLGQKQLQGFNSMNNTATENKQEKLIPRYIHPQTQIQIFNLKLSKFIHRENSYRIPLDFFSPTIKIAFKANGSVYRPKRHREKLLFLSPWVYVCLPFQARDIAGINLFPRRCDFQLCVQDFFCEDQRSPKNSTLIEELRKTNGSWNHNFTTNPDRWVEGE